MLTTLAVTFDTNSIIGLLLFILFIAALISILMSSLPLGPKIIWILVALLLPVIGPIVWFLVGRK